MTYTGHIVSGKVVFDGPAPFAEGTRVRIEVLREEANATQLPTLAEQLAGIIAKAEGLPIDWAENHDKYLREEHSR